MLPFHMLRQEQLHPTAESPVTLTARPLQFAAIVQSKLHSGYVLLYAGAHAPQSAAWLYRTLQLAHAGPLHWFRHVQLQFGMTPLTVVAWLLQSDSKQTREQFGYIPAYPSAQLPQSSEALNCSAHVLHLAPLHELRQVQLHPLFVLPVTDAAFPLQLLATVHVRKHRGYVSYPLTHCEQSADALYGNGHELHVESVQFPRHRHVQFPASPLTLLERSLQSLALQIRVQFG